MTITTDLDPNTPNIDVGVVITHSAQVPALDKSIGRQCSGMKADVAGEVVYQNGPEGEPGFIKFEAGEGWLIAFDRILSSGTVDGVSKSTTLTAAQIIYFVMGPNVGAAK